MYILYIDKKEGMKTRDLECKRFPMECTSISGIIWNKQKWHVGCNKPPMECISGIFETNKKAM